MTGVAAAVHLARRCTEEKGQDEQEVAVKVFRSSQLNDAEHEASLLEHFAGVAGVVTLHEVIYSLDWCALVLEYAPRGSLHHYLASLPRGELPPPQEQEDILHSMLSGMAALHARRVVHLDVKKDNVLLKQGGGAMWCDLGEARELPSSGSTEGEDQEEPPGVFPEDEFGPQGMPYVYTRRAPEVWRASGGVSPAADVWAIGTIAIEP